MKSPIKLIGLDLDGTVLTDKKRITDQTKSAIQRAIQKGIIVIPVTGRPATGIPKELSDIAGIQYAITTNGATTHNLHTKEILYKNHLDSSTCQEIIKRISHYPVVFELFYNGFGHMEPDMLQHLFNKFKETPILPYLKSTRHSVDNLMEFVTFDKKSIEGISIMANSISQKNEIQTILSDITNINMVYTCPTDIEINHIKSDKGTALLRLAQSLHISKESIMACGDSGNDFSLIEKVGLGIAMGNADEKLKEIASYVTSSNEENGVAFAIEKFAL